MTLESQYQEFIKQNPDCSHWEFNEWLKFHSEKLEKKLNSLRYEDGSMVDVKLSKDDG